MISFQINSKFKLTDRKMIKIWLTNICKEEGVEIGDLTYLLVSAVQELSQKVKDLELQISGSR